MRLLCDQVTATVPEAVERVNTLGLVRFMFNIVPHGSKACYVIFKVDSYPDYLYYCEKLCKAPMSAKEFFC